MIAADTNFRIRSVVTAYVHARERVIRSGFLREIQWQNDKSLSSTTESYFLEQFAWVVLSSGMREAVVQAKFPGVQLAFRGFRSANDIIENHLSYSSNALLHFGHIPKINAIVAAAAHIKRHGFSYVLKELDQLGPSSLEKLPFMGPATSLHFAKNLGMDVAKPDRHLLRIASLVGYCDVQKLCSDIACYVGDRVAVVDLVFWRYATLSITYLEDLVHFLSRCGDLRTHDLRTATIGKANG